MTPAHRSWAERFVAQLEARVSLYRRIETGREGQDVIVDVLQWHIDRNRAALAASISVSQPVASSVTVADPASRRHPLSGTWRDGMLSSASTMRALGDDAAARLYEAHATRANPDGSRPDDEGAVCPVDEEAQARLAAIVPFSAGPQMGLF
jgi:hypothetical protein